MVYHSEFNSLEVKSACGCPLLPLNTTARGPAISTTNPDIIDEAIRFFRCNVLFRSMEVHGPADKLLIYLTFYISSCLKCKKVAGVGIIVRMILALSNSFAGKKALIPGSRKTFM
jgi:ARP2/3 complex ARPC3 (21 kDa) subunit